MEEKKAEAFLLSVLQKRQRWGFLLAELGLSIQKSVPVQLALSQSWHVPATVSKVGHCCFCLLSLTAN